MADSKKENAGKPKKSFFKGVKQEWNKIIWVSKEDLLRQTGLVAVISLLLGVLITLVDQGALQLVNWLMSI